MKLFASKILSSTLVKTVGNGFNASLVETPKHLNKIKEEVIYKRIGDLNSWYTKIIGLDEVKAYQDRVVHLQDKLLVTQERRREIGSALAVIRKRSNELQDQIHKIKRQDDLPRFLELMKSESETMREEKDVQEMFMACDREERDIFTAFTNAIRDSHEKQRIQLEYTKYLGLVLSIAGSFFAFTFSTLRKNDLKYFIEDHMREIGANNLNFIEATAPILHGIEETTKENEAVKKAIEDSYKGIVTLIDDKEKLATDAIRQFLSNDIKVVADIKGFLWLGIVSLIGVIIVKNMF